MSTHGPVLSRRALLQAVGAAAGATALSGCAGQAAKWGFAGDPGGSRAHLTYALWDGYQQVGYQASLDEFTKRHPKISVTIVQIPYASYQPKITASHVSGNAPDLFWANTPFVADWIKQGLMGDLTDRVQADGVDLAQYYPSLVDLHRHGGKIYGLPKDWDTIALYYNKTLFKKLGVPPPRELTWAPDGSGTFLPFLRSLTVDAGGHRAGQAGFDPSRIVTYAIGVPNDPQAGYGSYLAAGGGSIVPQAYADHVVLDSRENRATLTYLLETLGHEHVLVPPSEMGPNGNGDNAQVLFAQGRLALYQNGDWNTNTLSQLGAGFDIGVLRLPAGPQGDFSLFNGLTDGLNPDTQHPDEAWELAKWLGGPESQTIMGAGGYIWPAIESLDHLFLEYWQKKGIDLTPFLDAARGKTTLYPVAQGMGQAVADVTSALGPVFLGTTPVPSGLAAAQQVADHRISTAIAT